MEDKAQLSSAKFTFTLAATRLQVTKAQYRRVLRPLLDSTPGNAC